MSKLPIEAVDQLARITKTFVEQIIDVADKNGIGRNELMATVGRVFLMTSMGDFSNYYENEEKGAVVNG